MKQPARLLVIGSGGREHALAWALARDETVGAVICAPGNAGTASVASTAMVDAGDPEAVLALAERERADLTVIGPELPLTRGVADLFASRGRALFGPTRAAAEIESSKVFTKAFLQRHRVPTARHITCESLEAALAAVERGALGFPLVVKADGLAAGKGVVIAADADEARFAVLSMMVERRFGEAGSRVVLEECLRGEELSFFVLTDGRRVLPFGTAQDHKRALDGDCGPNTGGMGAFAPSPRVDDRLSGRILADIVLPVVDGLREEGREFRGFLYAGLMLTSDGPRVLEFNARLGDPEAQVILPRLDEPLFPLLSECARGDLRRDTCRFRPEPHVGVVMASGGYPEAYATGKVVEGLEGAAREPDVLVFHAGTRVQDGRVVTAGGRVLNVVGRGAGYREAIERAYAGIRAITFDGMHYRTDIGAKALRA